MRAQTYGERVDALPDWARDWLVGYGGTICRVEGDERYWFGPTDGRDGQFCAQGEVMRYTAPLVASVRLGPVHHGGEVAEIVYPLAGHEPGGLTHPGQTLLPVVVNGFSVGRAASYIEAAELMARDWTERVRP